jgi:hypothetical protein
MIAGHEVREIGSREHVVQFYRSDEELAEYVTDYLLDAIRGEGVAVVIATPGHRLAFSERLTDLGVDMGAARASGAYLDFDARQTLDEFMTGDTPDSAKFGATVGDVIRSAAHRGQPVRAYGEMVALLWDTGLVTAAIDLEALWNDLGQAEAFSLLCAYPADTVTDPGQSAAFAEVCDLHASVMASQAPVTARSFPESLDATTSARHFVTRTLREWGVEGLNADAELTVTEFAANAVVHARSAFTVTIAVTDDTVRITVRDSAPLVSGAPELPARPLHGLGAVAAMARVWGVEPLGNSGKLVWAELFR